MHAILQGDESGSQQGPGMLPGEGDIPIKQLFTALQEVGTVETIGLEIFS